MNMRVSKSTADKEGGCNWCRARDVVYTVRSDLSTLAIRFCATCLSETVASARAVGFRTVPAVRHAEDLSTRGH